MWRLEATAVRLGVRPGQGQAYGPCRVRDVCLVLARSMVVCT